jgi:hypothetical protein
MHRIIRCHPHLAPAWREGPSKTGGGILMFVVIILMANFLLPGPRPSLAHPLRICPSSSGCRCGAQRSRFVLESWHEAYLRNSSAVPGAFGRPGMAAG